ncbi:derlin- [Olea europaea subsp. europaea]|uniref:Derlin n=1 Tax=Olea europaea subsp. europaea TaxID=158383 RepID=A0A8S0TTT3_OLEEU|nr:derlin- [Olea europaea subsp. europaea]
MKQLQFQSAKKEEAVLLVGLKGFLCCVELSIVFHFLGFFGLGIWGLGFDRLNFRNFEGIRMAQAVEEWYKQMPIITRTYLTAAIVTTIGCSLEIISPYDLYLNPVLVVKHYQVWRIVTNFLYFRKMDLDFLFHMFFLARYCKLLEENSFRGRTADFFYMILFGASVLTGTVLIGGMIPYISESFARIIFLSNSLTFMMVSLPENKTQLLINNLTEECHTFFLILIFLIVRFMFGASRTHTSI